MSSYTWHDPSFCDIDVHARQIYLWVLARALYIKDIHGAKTNNDKPDSRKIVKPLRAGVLPQAYPYLADAHSTREPLRRCDYSMYQHSKLLAHIENTNTQDNFQPIAKCGVHRSNRVQIVEHFSGKIVATTIEADMLLLEVHQQILLDLAARASAGARSARPRAAVLDPASREGAVDHCEEAGAGCLHDAREAPAR